MCVVHNTNTDGRKLNMERKAVSEETRSGEEESSDSDGAPPENISLSQGREEAMKARRESARETKRATACLKEKRRKREELFTSQKEEKKHLMKFPKTALKKFLEIEGDHHKEKPDPISTTRKARKRRKAEKQTPTEHEFGSVKVAVLEDLQGARPVAASRDAALNFVQQSLYHNSRYRRVPVLSFQAKKYMNRPARNFVVDTQRTT